MPMKVSSSWCAQKAWCCINSVGEISVSLQLVNEVDLRLQPRRVGNDEVVSVLLNGESEAQGTVTAPRI
jgi:hypothetical protein